jgi:hypothetical protein
MTMKLTKAELKWIKDVQTVLDSCPSNRLGFYTIGDPDVTIYDRTKDSEIDRLMDKSNCDYGSAVDDAGAGSTASLIFPAAVHSVAG